MRNPSANSLTSTSTSHLHFENTIGRVLVHPAGHYIAIEYHAGFRQPSELQTFLTQAGNVLSYWGWDKLLTTCLAMPNFTWEEIEELSTYWRTSVPQRPGILHGALLLPHAVFARLSWQGSPAGSATLVPS